MQGEYKMKPLLLKNARLVNNGQVTPASVLIENGKVTHIFAPPKTAKISKAAQVIDLDGLFAAPGFIDLHINGVKPHVSRNCSDEDFFRTMAKLLPRYGVSAFLPTIYTCRFARMRDKLKAIAEIMKNPKPGHARVLGAHLEGPFLSPERKGSHPPEEVMAPSIQKAQELWDASQGSIRIMTFAPELKGSDKLIGFCKKHSIVPAIGHTDADFETIMHAAQQGMRYATHLFNAMSPFSAREPGTVGAVLSEDSIVTEIIADGVHVSPEAIKLATKLKGVDNLILVSDGISAIKEQDGSFSFEDRAVILEKKAIRLENGLLAGSTAMMDTGLQTLIQKCAFSVPDAVAAASTNPARALRLQPEGFGYISTNRPANITVFDEHCRIHMTITPDGIAYEKKSASA